MVETGTKNALPRFPQFAPILYAIAVNRCNTAAFVPQFTPLDPINPSNQVLLFPQQQGGVAQLERAIAYEAIGCEFESHPRHFVSGTLADMVYAQD